jgi:hypothetical protein
MTTIPQPFNVAPRAQKKAPRRKPAIAPKLRGAIQFVA